jgi:hypothetical protein
MSPDHQSGLFVFLVGLPAGPPREWSYEALFDDLPIPDPVLV